MSNVVSKFNIAKNKRLLEIIHDYLPFTIRATVSKEIMLNNIQFFNVERMFETALENASNGKYKCVDTNGYDFTDFSDAKTASLNHNGTNTIGCTLDHLEYKIGSLRVAVYNPITEDFDFLYIPHSVYSSLSYERGRSINPGQTLGANTKTKEKRLRLTYSKQTRCYKNNMERYRVATFQDLALAEEKDFYDIESALA